MTNCNCFSHNLSQLTQGSDFLIGLHKLFSKTCKSKVTLHLFNLAKIVHTQHKCMFMRENKIGCVRYCCSICVRKISVCRVYGLLLIFCPAEVPPDMLLIMRTCNKDFFNEAYVLHIISCICYLFSYFT